MKSLFLLSTVILTLFSTSCGTNESNPVEKAKFTLLCNNNVVIMSVDSLELSFINPETDLITLVSETYRRGGSYLSLSKDIFLDSTELVREVIQPKVAILYQNDMDVVKKNLLFGNKS